MGTFMSKFFDKFKKELRILMLGLDAAGKTSILYKLQLGQTVATIPTVGFNVETLSYRNVKLNTWDVGGQDKIRPLWSFYYAGIQGLIFVVDCVDKERCEEAKQELHRILHHEEMRQAVVLVFANKQDVPGALTPFELQDRLGMVELTGRIWFVQPCCAITGDGLYEGLAWLHANLDV